MAPVRPIDITEETPLGKKRSKPIVFANLGNEEALSEKHAQQLVASFEQVFDRSSRGIKAEARSLPLCVRIVAA